MGLAVQDQTRVIHQRRHGLFEFCFTMSHCFIVHVSNSIQSRKRFIRICNRPYKVDIKIGNANYTNLVEACRFLLAGSLFSNASRYLLLFLKMFPTCDRLLLYHSANCQWLLPLLSLIASSFPFKLSLFLTRLSAVASISFLFIMPLILQHFATSRACYSYKCSLVFKQTIVNLVIHSVLLLASMTELSMVPCFSIKFTQPLSLGLRICLQSVI